MGKKPNKLKNTVNEQFRSLFLFLTDGIWRITENEVTGFRERLYNLIKVIILSVRCYKEDELQNKASALTYYTLLSIVPILAMFFAIARGFGFQTVLEEELAKSFEAQSEVLIQI
ncbi:MAG: YhjD/YihY/BrkB family envelope integrity protein, partial [Bacteroidales bacterium]|nr:YhjD/YihY/BrkB family envelope integrity protein [Bacteroidales bacterium]